ncbi:tetratricopeptide repeat protein [Microbulbifer sp. SH-1]|uniref:tetratricopeptide repeat protein n=1 Tax=Microbulbifer sp. SH-1 TaxID=2681547 RepID=UPI00140B4531|nr:tetratricopeptide repeat protein [Microbulbifer sp. SH-1]QIL88700.1 tetratricopeptide repeat protein [Microbulbifer sp. SH-1]
MRDRRLTFLRALPWLLLLPLLPACSLVQAPQSLEGFPPGTLQEIRQQVTELGELQKLDDATPAQRQHIQRVRRNLQQFERDTIRTANRLEKKDDWRAAKQVLQSAARVLPHSAAIESAQQQLAARRQLHEARVRMELEIHRGEQLLKDAEAYRRLQQLKEPGALTWLELKNYDRQRRASAGALQESAQKALLREKPEDIALARKALTIARGLYGDDLQQDDVLRQSLEQDLAAANRHLRRASPRPARAPQQKPDENHVAELQRALESGDLPSARQQLNWLQQHSPQHPQLLPLQSRFRMQLNTRVDTALTRGNHLYSQGEIERALQVWREANALDPDNVELLGNIARAEKVLENLRALSAPAGTSP